ncbi:DoxX family protein [Dyella jiangningensis]|uniref:DoxX family protein n=1 Tax=Dyella jiangningensis TaxID=1379159 RepID=UPI002410375B|nr:DoxX family protein [Dyella jiangningensis]MDG2538968.1 DoxX family protein [Dyella jiangningensis]
MTLKTPSTMASRWLVTPVVHWFALLGLCAAYLQGGIQKLMDFHGAVAESAHFGMTPAVPVTVAVIALELGASLAILCHRGRWLGAVLLAMFTLAATFVANRFWHAPAAERFGMTNAFFEHLGLVGGFVLVAWHDLRDRAASPSSSARS